MKNIGDQETDCSNSMPGAFHVIEYDRKSSGLRNYFNNNLMIDVSLIDSLSHALIINRIYGTNGSDARHAVTKHIIDGLPGEKKGYLSKCHNILHPDTIGIIRSICEKLNLHIVIYQTIITSSGYNKRNGIIGAELGERLLDIKPQHDNILMTNHMDIIDSDCYYPCNKMPLKISIAYWGNVNDIRVLGVGKTDYDHSHHHFKESYSLIYSGTSHSGQIIGSVDRYLAQQTVPKLTANHYSCTLMDELRMTAINSVEFVFTDSSDYTNLERVNKNIMQGYLEIEDQYNASTNNSTINLNETSSYDSKRKNPIDQGYEKILQFMGLDSMLYTSFRLRQLGTHYHEYDKTVRRIGEYLGNNVTMRPIVCQV